MNFLYRIDPWLTDFGFQLLDFFYQVSYADHGYGQCALHKEW